MNQYTNEVVVIEKSHMSKFIQLAIEHGIAFKTMDNSNAEAIANLAQRQSEEYYYQSSEEYDSSSC